MIDHSALQIETEGTSPAVSEPTRDPRVADCHILSRAE
jgi:hypothetical protein